MCSSELAHAQEQSAWLKELESELLLEAELAFMKQIVEPLRGKGMDLEESYQAVGKWLSDGGTANEPQSFRIISLTLVFFGSRQDSELPVLNTHIERFDGEDYVSCIAVVRLPSSINTPRMTMVSLIEVEDSAGNHVFESKKRFKYSDGKWSCFFTRVRALTDAE